MKFRVQKTSYEKLGIFDLLPFFVKALFYNLVLLGPDNAALKFTRK